MSRHALVRRGTVSVARGTPFQCRDIFGTVRKGCRSFADFLRRGAKYPRVHHVSVPGTAAVETEGLHATLTCSQLERRLQMARVLEYIHVARHATS